MSVQSVYHTLYDLLFAWLTDEELRNRHDDLGDALEEHGFDDVSPADLVACLPLIAEDLSPQYQVAIYEELQAMTDTGSRFEVNQGGGETAAMQGAGGGAAPAGGEAGVASNGGYGGASPMDAVVRHIQNITEHNYSWIDDRDVTTHVSALGDVDFDQILASGDGAIAADGDVKGANTGTNNGIVAGDDVDDAEVTNVTGNRNVTGEVGDDATVVTGDDNVLAKDSNVVDGDFEGVFIGDDVTAGGQSALNFGDGTLGMDNSVDNSTDISDAYKTDNSVEAKDSWNTDKSVNDSGNTTTKVQDSYQDNDTDKSDHSTHTDLDVTVKDAFQDHSDHSTEWSYEEESNRYTKTINETNTDLDVDVDVKESFIHD